MKLQNIRIKYLWITQLKKKLSVLEKYKEKFLEGSTSVGGLMAEYADSLWNDILGFADYCLAGDTEILIPTMTRRSKKIKDIVEDQYELFVLSHDGDQFNPWVSQKVSQWHDRGVKDVYRYTLEDGSYVDCTADHHFLTTNQKYISVDKCYTDNVELYSIND